MVSSSSKAAGAQAPDRAIFDMVMQQREERGLLNACVLFCATATVPKTTNGLPNRQTAVEKAAKVAERGWQEMEWFHGIMERGATAFLLQHRSVDDVAYS